MSERGRVLAVYAINYKRLEEYGAVFGFTGLLVDHNCE